MIKRWYVGVPALLMAIALPALAWVAIAPKYQSTSTISLLNSPAASGAAGRSGNPFSAFDNSLIPAADFLARRLSSDQSMEDLAKKGVTDLAAAALSPNASGPFLTLTITGKDPVNVLAEMQTFDQYAMDQLAAIQTSTANPLPPNTLLRAVVVVPPQKPVSSVKSKIQDVAAAAAAGGVLLFAAVFGTEALALRRAGASLGSLRTRKTAPAVPETVTAATSRRRSRSAGIPSLSDEEEPAPRSSGSLAQRPQRTQRSRQPTPAPSAMSDTIALPRYRDQDPDPDADLETEFGFEGEDEPDPEPWIDIDPLPLVNVPREALDDLAVGDRDAGSR
ncbi:MAG: hypothetical protein JF587_12255 [Catenulisporales bacterium]|nr:hypothetical protein [Catenulisporales bacterium]